MDKTKVFTAGSSQAVRIPKKYRFKTKEVEIRRRGKSIILSPIADTDALEAFLALPCCPDFTADRDAAQQIQPRELFR